MRDCLSDANNLEDTQAMGGTAQLEISILTVSHFLRKRVNIVVFLYFCKKKKKKDYSAAKVFCPGMFPPIIS